MILDTQPWRVRMVGYAAKHGLAPPGGTAEHPLPAEKGFVVAAHYRLGKPGRAFLERLQRHMREAGHTDVKVTGTLDAPTRAVLAPPMTHGELVAHWSVGEAQAGVHEVPWGSNDGPRIRFYQSFTLAFREPWCASFVSAGERVNGYKGPVSANAYHWLTLGQLVPWEAALPGDKVVFDMGNRATFAGHIGVFLGRVSEQRGAVLLKSVKTVDGNTSDEVAIRVRPMSDVAGIVRVPFPGG